MSMRKKIVPLEKMCRLEEIKMSSTKYKIVSVCRSNALTLTIAQCVKGFPRRVDVLLNACS